MAYLFEKITDGDVTLGTVFRLLHTFDKSIDYKFTRRDVRDVLDSVGFTSHSIGHVVRQLNNLYPLPSTYHGGCQRYADVELISYLRDHGFRVVKRLENLSVVDVIKILESKGYYVSGPLGDSLYTSLT